MQLSSDSLIITEELYDSWPDGRRQEFLGFLANHNVGLEPTLYPVKTGFPIRVYEGGILITPGQWINWTEHVKYRGS